MTAPLAPDDDQERTHLYRVFYADMQLCGCGNPEQAFELVRKVLDLAPFYEAERWRQLEPLIGSAGAVHIVLSAMTEADLIEHGGGIGGSWLTDKGRWMVAALRRHSDSEQLNRDLDDFGLPHGGTDCTAACWAVRS